MSFALQFRRGTTAEHSTFTGLQGEITVDTTKKTVVVHDGTTAGGIPLATANQAATADTYATNFLLGGM
jgi:RNase P/RNase MRP subunit p29